MAEWSLFFEPWVSPQPEGEEGEEKISKNTWINQSTVHTMCVLYMCGVHVCMCVHALNQLVMGASVALPLAVRTSQTEGSGATHDTTTITILHAVAAQQVAWQLLPWKLLLCVATMAMEKVLCTLPTTLHGL